MCEGNMTIASRQRFSAIKNTRIVARSKGFIIWSNVQSDRMAGGEASRSKVSALPPFGRLFCSQLFVMRPQSQYLHHSLSLEHLIYESVLDIDPSGVGPGEIAD